MHGHEALLRWRHPPRPGAAAAVHPHRRAHRGHRCLGAWVLRRAVADAAAGLTGGPGPDRVAVNVSAVQLVDEGFVAAVADALADAGLPRTCWCSR